MQAGDAAVIAAIEKGGGTVRPLAQNDERREVSFYLSGDAVKDANIAPVAKLDKVAQLHLGRTAVTDAGLAAIKGLTDLEQLHLENTKITDAGLVNLKGLTKLTYLNLYGDAVTDAGLANLTGLKALKRIFLWETKVTPEGAKKLQAAIPGLEVVMGWAAPAAETKPSVKAEKPETK
ncbi:MAG: hypothetical protein R2729_05160 [Bryobacteraceae bacterium]